MEQILMLMLMIGTFPISFTPAQLNCLLSLAYSSRLNIISRIPQNPSTFRTTISKKAFLRLNQSDFPLSNDLTPL